MMNQTGNFLLIFLIVLALITIHGNDNPILPGRATEAEEVDLEYDNHKIILVHGYYQDAADMLELKRNLEDQGFTGLLADLPLKFQSITQATDVFAEQVTEVIAEMDSDEKLSLVGHSTGGLVIRKYLAEPENRRDIHRAVLIATPNQGSSLVEMGGGLADAVAEIYTTLGSLEPDQVKNLELFESGEVEVGAIAGNISFGILGSLLDEENDGRVKVSSVKYEGLKDFIVVPYSHKDIHYQVETAELVAEFIKNGKFEGGNKDE
ncbi:MAG: alpha/beta fold hydrolase [Bacillota bacterium]